MTVGPEESAWRVAYGAWWIAATTGDWDAEHDLRMAAFSAWYDVPEEVKHGAWQRYEASRNPHPSG